MPNWSVLFNKSVVFISKSVNLWSSILKLPAVINLRASEFDFVIPNSVKTLGRCKLSSVGALKVSISSGIFLFIVIFSKDFWADSEYLASYNSVTI